LPTDGRPADYQGAVGEFALEIQASPRAIQAGDPVTIRTTISGQGNLDTLTAPALNLGEDFRVYEAKLISKELNSSGSSGRKIFEQVIIPRDSGEVALPPLSFSFFNPTLKTFIELKKEGLTIQVRESEQAASAVVMGQNGQPATRDLQVVDLDIAYLKPLPRTWVRLGDLARPTGPVPSWVHGLPPALLALTFLLTRQRRRREGNELLKRRQAAPKKARAGIQRAQQALATEDAAAYYEAVHQALFDFFSNRLGWAPGEFDSTRLTNHLQDQQAPDADINFLRELLLQAESVRYGAGMSESTQDDIGQKQLDQLAAVLKRSERS